MPEPVVQLRKGDADALGRVVWAEARSESFEGQSAIVWVIINRLRREQGRFPNTIQGIIKQPFAFSCFNTNDPQCARVKVIDERDPAFVEALHVVTAVATGRAPNPIGRADHYFLKAMRHPPAWATKMTFVRQVGGHVFFSELPVKE